VKNSPQGTPPLVVVDSSTDVASSLRAAEARFRGGFPGVFVARLNRREVSLGVGHSPSEELTARCRDLKIPLRRRATGGSAVLHAPGDIVWTLVLPRDHPRVGRDFTRAYARLGEGVTRYLASRGVEADWVTSPGISPDYCLLGARGQVLRIRDRVAGGAAQHLSHTTLLHHGILPAQVDVALIGDLFGLPAETIRARLIGLREIGIDPSDSAVSKGLAESLAASIRPP
jgi:lipoate-protein ligase A